MWPYTGGSHHSPWGRSQTEGWPRKPHLAERQETLDHALDRYSMFQDSYPDPSPEDLMRPIPRICIRQTYLPISTFLLTANIQILSFKR